MGSRVRRTNLHFKIPAGFYFPTKNYIWIFRNRLFVIYFFLKCIVNARYDVNKVNETLYYEYDMINCLENVINEWVLNSN